MRQAVTEKEWLQFGFKFDHRHGAQEGGRHDPKEVSPVFVQYLDCVWQLTRQFPRSFEQAAPGTADNTTHGRGRRQHDTLQTTRHTADNTTHRRRRRHRRRHKHKH